jgi:ABC-type transporter Mla subunit MlaD
MIITYSDGKRTTYARNLDDASAHVLVNNRGMVKTLESLSASCDGTSTNFTLIYNDGTTDYFIKNAVVLAANTTDLLTNHHIQLKPGDSLKVKASAGNHISVVAVTIDTPPVQSAGAPAGAVR